MKFTGRSEKDREGFVLCCSEDYAARACLVYNLRLNAYGQLGGCLKVAFPGDLCV